MPECAVWVVRQHPHFDITAYILRQIRRVGGEPFFRLAAPDKKTGYRVERCLAKERRLSFDCAKYG